VRKPFKKPRQAKERLSSPFKTVEKEDTDSEGPTQLQARLDNDGTRDVPMSEFLLEKTNNSEYIPSPASLRTLSESSDDDDNVPILATLKSKPNVIPLVQNIKMLSEREATKMAQHGDVLNYSSDSEGDEVPISQTLQTTTEGVKEAPEGEDAVGAGVARDFGRDVGMFKGQVVEVRKNRQRHIYHILYEDGDIREASATWFNGH
jgi:hypothetical protein